MVLENNSIKTAMILAAGLGTRLRPLTESIPKALVTIHGEAMLDIIIEQIRSLKINRIIINTHYLADQIANHVKKYKDIEITLSYEKEILGTGGGILNAMKKIAQETYLIVNCDCLFVYNAMSNPYTQLINAWDPTKMEFLLLSHPTESATFYKGTGDYNLNKEHKIVRTQKKQDYIWTGTYIIKPEFFKGYKVKFFSITDIVFDKSKRDRCYGIENKCKWIDIGSIEALKYVNEI